jgi:hypothetical protein
LFTRKTNELNLLVLKPKWFPWMLSIKIDLVETQYRLARCGNHLDGKDGSCASSERAIVCHTNPAPYWEYVFLQDRLTSLIFIRQEIGQELMLALAQFPALNHDVRFLAHDPTQQRRAS